MATYAELYGLRSNSDLRNKIAVACAVKAAALIDLSTPTASQLAWAKAALADPLGVADDVMNYVLARNAAVTTQQILAASDVAIQSNVNDAADKLASGGS